MKILDLIDEHDWSQGFESFTSFAPVVERMMQGELIRDALVGCLVENARVRLSRLSTAFAFANPLVLATNDFVEVSLVEVDPSRRRVFPVQTLAEAVVVGCIGPRAIAIDSWRVDERNSTLRLGQHACRVLKPLQAGATQAGDAVRIDCDMRTLAVSVISKKTNGVQHAFDRDTGEHQMSSTASTQYSRLAYALEFLDTYGRSSEAILAELAAHHAYFIRWRAIQALTRKNPSLGLNHIRRALHDESPVIREAAARTLEMNGIKQ